MSVIVHHGDSRHVLKALAENSLDSCVTDPPYALESIVARFGAEDAAPAAGGVYARSSGGFMGQQWDTGEVAFDPEFWREVWRVLKPGAWLLAFGGSRTYHNVGWAIEQAGFEVRDSILDLIAPDAAIRAFLNSLSEEQIRAFAKCIEESEFGGLLAWIYGTGFPKNTDFAAVPGSKKDGGREIRPEFIGTDFAEGWGTALKPAFEPIVIARKPLSEPTIAANVAKWGTGGLNISASRIAAEKPTGWGGGAAGGGTWTEDNCGLAKGGDARPVDGRWPSNVVHDGSPAVVDAFPEGESPAPRKTKRSPDGDGRVGYGAFGGQAEVVIGHGDAGTASRFFYSAKADDEDRLGSGHPTVKPVDLIRYFIRMATPPGGTILDPFAGSGSAGIAAMTAGFNAVLIEREERFVADIRRRIAWASGEGRLTALEKARDLNTEEGRLKAAGGDTPLFGGAV